MQRATYHKAAINTNSHSQHAEHIRNLVSTTSKSTWPSDANSLTKERSQRVKYSVCDWQDKHIVVWEVELDEKGRDHLSDGVGVDETCEEDEWDQMVV